MGYLGDTITNTNLDQLYQELHATAVALSQAKARGDTVDAQALQQHFDAVKAQYLAVAKQSDAPTYWEGVLARIGDVQQAVSEVGSAAVTGLKTTGYLLPLVLAGVAVLYFGPVLSRLLPKRRASS